MQEMTVGELASALGCQLEGDPAIRIGRVRGMEHAVEGDLTFLANPKYAPKLRNTKASAVLAAQPVGGIATLISSNPYHDFARALELFYQPPRPPAGIHASAAISDSAQIGEGASIGAFAVVGEDVVIGRNAVLHP